MDIFRIYIICSCFIEYVGEYMELIIDFLFEVLLEGSFEIMMSKKTPLFLRILVGIPLGIVYIGLFLLFAYLCFDSIRNYDYGFAFMFLIIDIIYIFIIIHLVRKRRTS